MVVAPELHTPPSTASESVVTEPAHTFAVPAMVPAAGRAFTVTTLTALAVPQLFVTVYDILAVPWAIPATTPIVFMVAMPVDPELHTPPSTASVSVDTDPGQIFALPAIVPAAGSGFTVTTMVERAVPQLLVVVKDIVAVPALTPLTTPLELTDAVAGEEELHEPSPEDKPRVRVTVVPEHSVVVPLIEPAKGNGFTVTPFVVYPGPQLVVTVYVIFAVPWAMPVATPVALTVTTAVALDVQVPPLIAAV